MNFLQAADYGGVEVVNSEQNQRVIRQAERGENSFECGDGCGVVAQEQEIFFGVDRAAVRDIFGQKLRARRRRQENFAPAIRFEQRVTSQKNFVVRILTGGEPRCKENCYDFVKANDFFSAFVNFKRVCREFNISGRRNFLT